MTQKKMEVGDLPLNEKLRYFRERENLSRKELAKITNISESSIEKYELGIRKPKIASLELLAHALNTEVFILIGPSYWSNEEQMAWKIEANKNTAYFKFLRNSGFDIINDYDPFMTKSKNNEIAESLIKAVQENNVNAFSYFVITKNNKTFYLTNDSFYELQEDVLNYIYTALDKYDFRNNKDPD